MKRFLLVAAAALALAALQPDNASARPVFGGFGGFHGGMVGGGFRGGVVGGGFRTAAIGGGWRGGWVGRPGLGWGGVGRPGWGWGGGWVGRPGWGWGGRWGWGRGWGWGWPIAAGIGIGALGYYSDVGYDQCLVWNGFRWVNTCAGPYGYNW
jgi:hypothetical protein